MTEYIKLEAPPIDRREIMRYAGERTCESFQELIDDSLNKLGGVLNYSVAFCELKFTICGETCDFEHFSVSSRSLAQNLFKAKRVFVFIASIGHGPDRLIAKYSRTSPLRALLFNAIGTERVEALADAFVKWLEEKSSMRALPRFSAGYGDLSLSLQKNIFDVLQPERQMGVFLSDAFIMSPSKSVTAFVGLE